MIIPQIAQQILGDLRQYLVQMPNALYVQPLDLLFGSSLGQHTRHIIEFFQCLQEQLVQEKICYDLRKRDLLIEQSTTVAVACIDNINNWLEGVAIDHSLLLNTNHGIDCDQKAVVSSSLYRELLFNIEHAIHHMAILKIGTKIVLPEWDLPQQFGVAPSTIRHQKTLLVPA